MKLFSAVRAFSIAELALFIALLIVWIGDISDGAKFALGLGHGIGVIALCLLVYIGCIRRVFPWTLLAAAVLTGPVGSTIGIERMRSRMSAEAEIKSPASAEAAVTVADRS